MNNTASATQKNFIAFFLKKCRVPIEESVLRILTKAKLIKSKKVTAPHVTGAVTINALHEIFPRSDKNNA
jgi:hypothetical protein